MERQNSERPRHGRRDSRTHQSARLSAPLTSSPGTAVPARPEPVAASPPRDTQTKRHRATLSGPRSILHQSATCSNELCDDPEIPTDGRLCRGPEGLDLCIRCYKRFKIERRRAREEQRDMTEAWRRPKPSRSNLPTASPTTLETARGAYTSKPHRKHSDQPSGGRVARASRRVDSYAEKPPLYEPEDKSTKQPSPHVTLLSQSEKSESLHNFPTSSVQEYGRLNSQSPRKHRSQREKAERRHSHYSQTRNASAHDEGRFHKHSQWGEDGDGYSSRRSCCGGWSRRRKCVIFGTAVTSTVLLVLIIALAVTLSRKDKFNYTPSFAQVNSSLAFESGGGTRKNVNDTNDGIGAGTDTYVYYQGNASNFPAKSQWISFKDMWDNNYDTFKHSCGWLKRGDDNTPEMIRDIYNAIQDRANASLVDHRIILATIIQETNGCPLSPPTTSSGGTRNPGLMQSHNGHAYDAKHSRLSILLMVQDGTQGTQHGWGLVDNLNTYGDPYKAMRGYNSGYIPDNGNLSDAAGATACYVSDIANRLTGWVRAVSTCPGDA